MPYSASTYVPGDAWTSTDFYCSALTPPRISANVDAVNSATTASYFEYRSGKGTVQDPRVQVVIAGGSGTYTIVLEASFDEGVSWIIQKSYTAPVVEAFDVEGPVMYRLRVSARTGSGAIPVKLLQMP